MNDAARQSAVLKLRGLSVGEAAHVPELAAFGSEAELQFPVYDGRGAEVARETRYFQRVDGHEWRRILAASPRGNSPLGIPPTDPPIT